MGKKTLIVLAGIAAIAVAYTFRDKLPFIKKASDEADPNTIDVPVTPVNASPEPAKTPAPAPAPAKVEPPKQAPKPQDKPKPEQAPAQPAKTDGK